MLLIKFRKVEKAVAGMSFVGIAFSHGLVMVCIMGRDTINSFVGLRI